MSKLSFYTQIRTKGMNRKLFKTASLWVVLALVVPLIAVLFTAKPAEAG